MTQKNRDDRRRPGERTDTRLGYRADCYPRTSVTRVGKLELRVPRDRDGRFAVPGATAPGFSPGTPTSP